MSGGAKFDVVARELRGVLAGFKPGQETYDAIVVPREQVLARYGPVFSPAHIPELTKEEFVSFLYLENNRHWSGLYRTGLGAAKDMKALRRALAILLDEGQSLSERFPQALSMVKGFGKGIATGILVVANPTKYGVWNNTSEAGMRKAGLWPDVDRGEGVGRRYERINEILVRLSQELEIDLWTLDALWWYLLEPQPDSREKEPSTSVVPETGGRFGLERQLEAFLLENWERTLLGKDWDIYSTPEDLEAGNQYPTDIGRIDILASHKHDPAFLVIELKRNQTTDQTVGQVLRYVGWVKKHLATDGQRVEALIIGYRAEKEAYYALATLPDVRMMTYEVEFRLKVAEGP
jgi:hypothetical protein